VRVRLCKEVQTGFARLSAAWTTTGMLGVPVMLKPNCDYSGRDSSPSCPRRVQRCKGSPPDASARRPYLNSYAKLIGAHAKAAIGGLDQRVPEHGRLTPTRIAPAAGARQIIDGRGFVNRPWDIECRGNRDWSVALEIHTGQSEAPSERLLPEREHAAGDRGGC